MCATRTLALELPRPLPRRLHGVDGVHDHRQAETEQLIGDRFNHEVGRQTRGLVPLDACPPKAASTGSTERTAACRARPRSSATALLPDPGSPANDTSTAALSQLAA